MTQNSTESFLLYDFMSPFYEYRPELSRNGDVVAYTEQAQKNLESAQKQPPNGSMAMIELIPRREYFSNLIRLEDWYESPLRSGHYQLTVRKQFVSDGDWVESNPVTFDVRAPKIPNPIPAGFKVRLVTERLKEQTSHQPDRLDYNHGLVTELVNDSDQRVYVTVIDKYYGHRLELTKDGKVIPYRDDVASLIESKEKDPGLVEEVKGFWLEANTVQRLDGFSLKQWYGPLAPGIYHLTDRRRFEIRGPWTKESPELVFQLIP